MKKLRVGVIGCGKMGSFHLKQYANIADAELVGASDVDPSRCITGIPFFGDHKKLLRSVDAVSIVTPTFTHFEMADEALDMGVSVLIEKPIAMNAEQGERLIKKAKEKKLVLSVGHIERFSPAYMKIEKELNKNKPRIIDIKRFSPLPERIADVSCVMDMMIHDIDLALKLSGSRVKQVNAIGKKIRTERLDTAHAVIVFDGGTIANIETSRVHSEKVRSILVAAGDKIYDADLLNKTVRVQNAKGMVELPVETHDQLNYELRKFIDAVAKRSRPVVTGEDGLAALVIAEQIEKAALSS